MNFFKDFPILKVLLFCSLSVAVMASRPGGLGAEKPGDADVQQVINDVKPSVEEKLGKTLDQYTAVSYKTQVVSGINYFVKIQVGANDFIHARIYKSFSGAPELHGVQESKSANEGIEYF